MSSWTVCNPNWTSFMVSCKDIKNQSFKWEILWLIINWKFYYCSMAFKIFIKTFKILLFSFIHTHMHTQASPVTQWLRICLKCKRSKFGPQVRKISLEMRMATRSSILAWRIPWTEEPGELQSMGSQRAGHIWAHIHTHIHISVDIKNKWNIYLVHCNLKH